ncbi:MAG: UDP-2,3-diacylglucosamine diphosphatase [Oligoflexia bacterium]|nr:UDP-2,3-diacylglucosamine diphosphatase [Oligoflexia bacterium]
MSMAIISDVHAKESDSEEYKLLLRFLKHKKTTEAREIFLLGDIFEFMCGRRSLYYQKFSEYFDILASLIKEGRVIHYFEGNHDFHLKELYANYFKLKNINTNDIGNFKIHYGALELERFGKKFMFAHGDEIFFDGVIYPIYKKTIMSFPIKKAMQVIPDDVLDTLGEIASNLSKGIRRRKNLDYSFIRNNFRDKVALLATKKKYDVVVLGHVHVQDNFVSDIKNFQYQYLNNGHITETHSFIYISDEGREEFVRI